MSLLIDLDPLAEADRQSPLFGVNRPTLTVSTKPTTASATGRRCAPPRLLGYTLNPLLVYFCYRASGELTLRIYEVRNTSGYIHAYILPVKSGDINDAGVRQQQDKLFYAKGRAAGAADGRAPQHRLGDWEKQRLYFAGVVHPNPD